MPVYKGLKLALPNRYVIMSASSITSYSNGSEKAIEDLRKNGLDKDMLERIAADRAEMACASKEAKERLPWGLHKSKGR